MKTRAYCVCTRIVLLIVLCILGACTDKATIKNSIVSEWIGRKIYFPANVSSLNSELCVNSNVPYRILVYTDSVGCISCKLKLYQWNTFIKEVQKEMIDKVCFYFYFQPKNEHKLLSLFKRENFKYPVFIDNENRLNELNHFPDTMKYQCFLLDKDDKVVLVGNPTSNLKLWDLYKQVISGKQNVNNIEVPETVVKVEQASIELKNLKVKEGSIATFTLINSGKVPLILYDVVTSCGCAVPEWSRQMILPQKKSEIKVKIKPDIIGLFQKEIKVDCNIREKIIRLSVKGIVTDSTKKKGEE